MTIVRVDPTSIRAYGNDAQQKFNSIREELIALVAAVTEVHYYGPNAAEFKTRTGAYAADFANDVSKDLGAIALAVRTSTTNIATSLGGQLIDIEVNGTPIVASVVAPVDTVDVDTSALEALKGTIDRHFIAIAGLFDQHLQALSGTDWQGVARNDAVDTVTRYTESARAKCEEAQAGLNSFITKQVEDVHTADR